MADKAPEVVVDEEDKLIRFRGKYVSAVPKIYEIIKNTPESERKQKMVEVIGFESLNGEEDYTKYYTPKPGETVVDCGAHVGVMTQHFSEMVGDKGLVLCVEPDYRALGMLMHNTEDLNNIKIAPYALWDKEDILPIHFADVVSGVGMSSITSQFQYWHPTRAITLDNLLKRLSIKNVDFIKMDIEGAELFALEGMKETLKDVKGVAIAAYHPIDNEGNKTYPKVIEFLKSQGFKPIFEKGFDGEIVYATR